MKKYLVIGNPISHSLSPMLHNYWFKQYNIEAQYEKKQLLEKDLKNIINDLRDDKISGINVTVPFKKSIIPFLDKLTVEATKTQSVNTIFKVDNEIRGHNTEELEVFDRAKRATIDREITDHAIDFIKRKAKSDKQFFTFNIN